MLACENQECSRRFCEHCLQTHLNEDVDPMSSDAWTLVDGKVTTTYVPPSSLLSSHPATHPHSGPPLLDFVSKPHTHPHTSLRCHAGLEGSCPVLIF